MARSQLPPKTMQQLLERYESLSPLEQSILQLISIVFETTTSEIVSTCIAEMRSDSDFVDAVSPFNLLRKLQDRDLVTWRYQCNPLLVEIISRHAVAQGAFPTMAAIVQKNLPTHGPSFQALHTKSRRHIREMRIGLYQQDFSHFNDHLFKFYDCPEIAEDQSPLLEIFNNPFDAEWFKSLPAHMQLHGLHEICKNSHLDLVSLEAPQAYLQDEEIYKIIPEEGWPSLYYLLIVNYLLMGNFDAARTKIIEAQSAIESFGLRGWLEFTSGNTEQALADFKNDLKELRKTQNNKNAFFIGIEGLIFILALLKTGDYKKWLQISSYVDAIENLQPHNPLLDSYKILGKVAKTQLENFSLDHNITFTPSDKKNCFTALFMGLGSYWLNGNIAADLIQELIGYFNKAKKHGYSWLAAEYAMLLFEATGNSSYDNFWQQHSGSSDSITFPLVTVIKAEKKWKRALKALNLISHNEKSGDMPEQRMVWLVDYKDGFVTISPREQKFSTSKGWSQGRAVALKRLYSGQNLDYLSDHDHKIRATLYRKQANTGISYKFDMDITLPALIGHPHLFLAGSRTVPVEFVKGEPELRAIQSGETFTLKFYPSLGDETVFALQETPTRFRVIEISANHRKITSVIGDDGLVVPIAAKDQVLETLVSLSTCMTIHSDIGGTSMDIDEMVASDRIIIQLVPMDNGFRISMLVRPFGQNGPYLYPGHGSENVMAEIEGKRLQTRRNLAGEQYKRATIEEKCPTLSRLSTSDDECFVDDLQDCLEILHELQSLDDDVVIEWPEGEKIAIRQHASFDNLHLNIRHKQNWFELNGSLIVDQEKVLEMQELLALTANHSGRFVPLGKGKFLALSKELRKQLDEVQSYGEMHKNNLRIHPLASCALENFAESCSSLETDDTWKKTIQRFRDCRDLTPEVPKTLQAELRDYQVEGFRWLGRLSHWGVGACLADDMGLGKTLQSLGIILQKAPNGPSLVVAPTSVCSNWMEEISRFAPTLNPVLFGGKMRQELIADMEAYDVLICSYGLLQQEAELLGAHTWQVIVLDEAQLIKNAATKRSKAAMGLTGAFKIITTGTPIENHLGELWNLFNFINPGLLGSPDTFTQRYSIPIERDGDKNARRRLKKLIQPFILRRLKSQVLEELPPRTEVILQVDMSEEELAFYEALRREAVSKISRSEAKPGQKQMQILAEIMRLRQACCNPSLVQADSTISSSKLNLFGKIIDELIENRHKALVFSQFTGHLKLIRAYLDSKNITYQYLDGSTPAKARRVQVDAFQAGQADLFLISLKAGGLGLNLTAADYVLHMDPWWNPAVEDQASDRAHRIGQVHPVTVYRLVMKNTIEEKIVKLHHNKRELANKLLEGSDISHKMNMDDFMKLLQEE